MKRPLVIDLCAGLGGWTRGFLAEGYDAVGFDIERHVYGEKRYPAQLVLQDIRTLHGSQFRHAAVIVASPPCQAYSYRAMPWKRAKALGPPDNTLFETCFRIAREAGVPIVVENVKGAQPWVGRAAWHYGSYYLWGDVPALMPHVIRAQKFNPDGTHHGQGSWFAVADSAHRGIKQHGSGPLWFDKELDERRREATATKRPGIDLERDGMNNYPADHEGLRTLPDGSRVRGRSNARKAASAMIAEIPYDLASWIARCYFPDAVQRREATICTVASTNHNDPRKPLGMSQFSGGIK